MERNREVQYNGTTIKMVKAHGWKGKPTVMISFDIKNGLKDSEDEAHKFVISTRQLEVVRLKSLGLNMDEIAAILKINRRHVMDNLFKATTENGLLIGECIDVLMKLRLISPFAIIGIKAMFDIPFDDIKPVSEKKLIQLVEQSKKVRKMKNGKTHS